MYRFHHPANGFDPGRKIDHMYKYYYNILLFIAFVLIGYIIGKILMPSHIYHGPNSSLFNNKVIKNNNRCYLYSINYHKCM
jgi:hypothetical protein